jgi:phosphoribosylanthranilate isomerase
VSKVKICGLKRKEDIKYVNEFKPDFIGFVFAGANRKIDFETAALLKSLLDKNIKAVGVFVNEPLENIIHLYEKNIIDIAQLHGGENEKYILELKSKSTIPVIKAFLPSVENKLALNAFSEICDFILFDSGSGSGEIFNWDLIKDYKRAFFLAGGLNASNIEKAIKDLNPYCLDISSGAETDRVKDLNKIKEICDICKKVNINQNL